MLPPEVTTPGVVVANAAGRKHAVSAAPLKPVQGLGGSRLTVVTETPPAPAVEPPETRQSRNAWPLRVIQLRDDVVVEPPAGGETTGGESDVVGGGGGARH